MGQNKALRVVLKLHLRYCLLFQLSLWLWEFYQVLANSILKGLSKALRIRHLLLNAMKRNNRMRGIFPDNPPTVQKQTEKKMKTLLTHSMEFK